MIYVETQAYAAELPDPRETGHQYELTGPYPASYPRLPTHQHKHHQH